MTGTDASASPELRPALSEPAQPLAEVAAAAKRRRAGGGDEQTDAPDRGET